MVAKIGGLIQGRILLNSLHLFCCLTIPIILVSAPVIVPAQAYNKRIIKEKDEICGFIYIYVCYLP